ncbi:hypothetical protein HOD29_04640 [archaeon]|jgi:sugar-specific transcriptional regulator TrmB|nr:hypothetical protein [archaeon]
MNKKIFKELGFTEGEISVYFALLDLGESTSGPIIKKSGISGSKVYEILDKLIQKGLVSHIIKEKTKYFQVASASRLVDYVEKREQELEGKKKEIEKMIPELEKKRKGIVSKRESFVLEGYGGIKTFFRMVLEEMKKGEEYYVVTLGPDLKNENVLLFLEQHHNKREEKGINIKILMNPAERKLVKHFDYKRMQVKYVKDSLPVGTFIFGDYVANVKFGDNPIVFVMKDERISESYKNFFLDLWGKARK